MTVTDQGTIDDLISALCNEIDESRWNADWPKSLTVKELAASIQVHPATIRRWIKIGDLPARRLGRLIRIDVGELQAYMKAHCLPRAGGSP